MRTIVEQIGSHYTPSATRLRLHLLRGKHSKPKHNHPKGIIDPKFRAPVHLNQKKIQPGAGPAPFGIMTLSELLKKEYENYKDEPSEGESGGDGLKNVDLGQKLVGKGKIQRKKSQIDFSKNLTSKAIEDAMEGVGR